jgi:hypothetical protein
MTDKRNNRTRTGFPILPIIIIIALGIAAAAWIPLRPQTIISIQSESFSSDSTVNISWITSAEYYVKTITGSEPTFSKGDSLEKSVEPGSDTVSFAMPSTLINRVKGEIEQDLVTGDNSAEICTDSDVWGRNCSHVQLADTATECTGDSCTNVTSFTVPSYCQIDISLALLMIFLSAAGTLLLILGNAHTFSHISKKLRESKLYPQLDRIGSKLSEERLLQFDGKVVGLLIVSMVIFAISVIFQIHTSSVYMWNNYLGPEHQQEGSLLGRPVAIRSDEWLVKTPSIFSQSYNEFPEENKNIGGEKAPLAMSLPVKDVTTLFRPQMWGYHIFGAERGFVFEWNFMAIGVFIGTFLCLMLFTGNQFTLSLIGSVWFYFASYNQWWLSSVSGILMSFMFMVVGGTYLLSSKRKPFIAAGGLIFLFSTVNFFLFLYPPYLIPLLYILAGIFLAAFVKHKISILDKHLFPTRLAITSFVIGAGLLIGYLFFQDIRETITAVGNTVYPGNRSSEGGAMDLLWVLSGYYTFLVRESSFPAALGNASEASNFILLSPLILPLSIYAALTKKIKIEPLHIVLGSIILLLTVWMVFPFPEVVREFFLLDRVFERRALFGLGIADLFFSISLISLILKEKVLPGTALIASWTFSTLFILFWGIVLYNESGFLNIPTMILVSIAISSFLALLTAKKYIPAVIAGLLILIPTMIINPVSTGMNVFEDEEITHTISEHPTATWAVYGNSNYANFLKAYGADVFNGVNYLPKEHLLQTIDPEGAYEYVYNRYAHVSMETPDPGTEVFELTYPDSYTIFVDPCDPALTEIGITHVLYTRPLDIEPACGVLIFSRIDGDVVLSAYELQLSGDVIESGHNSR